MAATAGWSSTVALYDNNGENHGLTSGDSARTLILRALQKEQAETTCEMRIAGRGRASWLLMSIPLLPDHWTVDSP